MIYPPRTQLGLANELVLWEKWQINTSQARANSLTSLRKTTPKLLRRSRPSPRCVRRSDPGPIGRERVGEPIPKGRHGAHPCLTPRPFGKNQRHQRAISSTDHLRTIQTPLRGTSGQHSSRNAGKVPILRDTRAQVPISGSR